MNKLWIALALAVGLSSAQAETAQEAAENAMFEASIGYSVDEVFQHYQRYRDVDGNWLDVVGYESLDLFEQNNGLEIYVLNLLIGDKHIPRIEQSCQVYIEVKAGRKADFGEILPENCE